MIIQSETIMSVVSSFEKIADKSDDVASKYLTNALKTATEENRTELLNSEKNEYEVLSERADALKEAVEEVRKKYEVDPLQTTKVVNACKKEIRKLNRQAKHFIPPGDNELVEKFKLMDFNGNNIVSLAEIDKYISEGYPLFDNKPALMRAYKAADYNRNGFVSLKEFKNLWKYIVFFNNLWEKFEEIREYQGNLLMDVGKIALSAALTIIYPTTGSRDEYCTAIAGILIKNSDWTDKEIDEFVSRIAEAANDDVEERSNKGSTTRKTDRKFGVNKIHELTGYSHRNIQGLFN